jgi:hypothetical protein
MHQGIVKGIRIRLGWEERPVFGVHGGGLITR